MEIIFSTLMEIITEMKIETYLVITSKDKFPDETKVGARIKRRGLKTLFEEADYIIPHQVDYAVIEDHTLIKFICSVTVFYNSAQCILLKIGPMQMFIWTFSISINKHQENNKKEGRFNTFTDDSSCANGM